MTTITIELTDEQIRTLFERLPEAEKIAAAPGMVRVEDFLDFSNAPEIRIKGHRVWLEHVVEHYIAGRSPEEIAQEFPGLGIERIYAAIAYYLANRETVDAHMAKLKEEAERGIREQAETPAGRRLLAIVGGEAAA